MALEFMLGAYFTISHCRTSFPEVFGTINLIKDGSKDALFHGEFVNDTKDYLGVYFPRFPAKNVAVELQLEWAHLYKLDNV